jgi:hypothetical protein
MTHMNSDFSNAVDERSSGLRAVSQPGGDEAHASKPADTIYRIAAMVGALILLFTVVWAG